MTNRMFFPNKALGEAIELVTREMLTAQVGDSVNFDKQKIQVRKNRYGSLVVNINVCNGYDMTIVKRTDKLDHFIIYNDWTFWSMPGENGNVDKPLKSIAYCKFSPNNGKRSVFGWDDTMDWTQSNRNFINNKDTGGSEDATPTEELEPEMYI